MSAPLCDGYGWVGPVVSGWACSGCPRCNANGYQSGRPPMTPSDRVREARDELDRAMERYANAEHPSREYPHNQRKYDRDVADNQHMLDAYAAAIRAERAAEIAALKADRDHLNEMYVSLLNEVAVKIPNETRYETARRYIREREAQRHEAGDAVRASETRGRE